MAASMCAPNQDRTEGIGMQELSELTFEQAFAELDSIVTQLEDDDLTLDATVALFERGRALARHCQTLLDTAELRVSQIDEGGEEASPNDPGAAPMTGRLPF
jgi:exodeoxyribonuclease VII small subunit